MCLKNKKFDILLSTFLGPIVIWGFALLIVFFLPKYAIGNMVINIVGEEVYQRL